MRLLLALALLLVVVTAGCTAVPREKPAPAPAPVELLTGVSLSPRSTDAQDFTRFFSEAQDAGGVVMWAGDWLELEKPAGAPAVVMTLAAPPSFTPVVVAQFFGERGGLSPLQRRSVGGYRDVAAAFAEKHKPPYLGLGIEVNRFTGDPDFDLYVQLFAETAKAVHRASPETKVFPVFQLELMKGVLSGKGGVAQWELLKRFPDADLFAFTTYPGLVYKDPSEIPAAYYSDVRKQTEKPVAFSESGWHRDPAPTGWESSDEEQARFAALLLQRMRALAPEFAVWSFLYDPVAEVPFNSMGLKNADGTARPAWAAWTAG